MNMSKHRTSYHSSNSGLSKSGFRTKSVPKNSIPSIATIFRKIEVGYAYSKCPLLPLSSSTWILTPCHSLTII